MHRNRRRLSAVLVVLLAGSVAACVSPFTEHAQDVKTKWDRDFEAMHRKWDRYFLNLDWDDPWMDWKDESYARGPMNRDR